MTASLRSAPYSRVVRNAEALEGGLADGPVKVKYMLVDTDCGSRKQVHTVREWLARFGIPEHDELFLMWSRLTAMLHRMICELEEHHVSNETLNLFWSAIFSTLYLDYDTSTEFLPQFRQATEKLSSLCQGVAEVGTFFPAGKGALRRKPKLHIYIRNSKWKEGRGHDIKIFVSERRDLSCTA